MVAEKKLFIASKKVFIASDRLCEIVIWQTNIRRMIDGNFLKHFSGCFDFKSCVSRKTVVRLDKHKTLLKLLCWCFEPCLFAFFVQFIAIKLHWNFKQFCFYFFQNLSFQIGGAAYLWVRLIHLRLRYFLFSIKEKKTNSFRSKIQSQNSITKSRQPSQSPTKMFPQKRPKHFVTKNV